MHNCPQPQSLIDLANLWFLTMFFTARFSTIMNQLNYLIKTVIMGDGFKADVAELVDALDLGSSVFDVRVRVSPSASPINVF